MQWVALKAKAQHERSVFSDSKSGYGLVKMVRSTEQEARVGMEEKV